MHRYRLKQTGLKFTAETKSGFLLTCGTVIIIFFFLPFASSMCKCKIDCWVSFPNFKIVTLGVGAHSQSLNTNSLKRVSAGAYSPFGKRYHRIVIPRCQWVSMAMRTSKRFNFGDKMWPSFLRERLSTLLQNHHRLFKIDQNIQKNNTAACLTFSWYWRREESKDWISAVAWPTNMA